MSTIVLTLPADDIELRDEIVEGLEAYAYVSEPPAAMDIDPQLIIQVIADATEFLANTAGVAAFLLMLKEQYGRKVRIKPLDDGTPPKVLSALSDEEVREIVGGSEE